MIKLTRLNGEELVVNADLIRFVESRPDTYVSLTTNDRLIVRESMEEVVRRVLAWTRTVRTPAAPLSSGDFDRSELARAANG